MNKLLRSKSFFLFLPVAYSSMFHKWWHIPWEESFYDFRRHWPDQNPEIWKYFVSEGVKSKVNLGGKQIKHRWHARPARDGMKSLLPAVLGLSCKRWGWGSCCFPAYHRPLSFGGSQCDSEPDRTEVGRETGKLKQCFSICWSQSLGGHIPDIYIMNKITVMK